MRSLSAVIHSLLPIAHLFACTAFAIHGDTRMAFVQFVGAVLVVAVMCAMHRVTFR